MQQRAIPESIVDLVIEIGEEVPRPGGASLYRVRAADRQALMHRLQGMLKELQMLGNKGVIVAPDGSVITVMHTRR